MDKRPSSITHEPRLGGGAKSPDGHDTQLDEAMRRLICEVRDGLRHGFFELSVQCEMVKGRKRRLIIKAGKTHQFTIPEGEIDN